jgi:HK97 family phage major capsid protein
MMTTNQGRIPEHSSRVQGTSVRRLRASVIAALALIGVTPVIIEFVRDIADAYKAGAIMEVPDDKARTLITMGDAKESDTLSLLRASNKADMDGFKAELLGEIRALRGGGQDNKGKKPPGSGQGVDFDRIDGAGPPDLAKFNQQERWFHAGQMVRALLCAQATDTPPEDREWGRNILHKQYCHSKRVEYKVDEDAERGGVARFNGNVGVTRTGTESISGGSTYGFLVRPEWSDTLFRLPIEESVIEPYAYQVPVGQAMEFRQPALDQYGTPSAGQSAAYAGFSLSRKGEITQRSASDGKVDEIDFKITDLTAYTTYSRDLDADAFIRIGALIQQVLGQAFQWRKDYEFINGNGVGMPLGILPGGGGSLSAAAAPLVPPSVLTYDRATNSKIYYEDIVGMMKQIHPALWKEMYWLTNAAQTLDQLVAIKTSASGNAFVFQPNSLVAQSQTPSVMGEGPSFSNTIFKNAQGYLQGKPVLFTEKLPQVGQVGDLILVNPRYAYGVATRAGLEMGMSEHFLFDTERIAVRWKLRNDAKPLLRGPFVQSDGGATSSNSKVSWCSVLAGHY